MARNRGFLRTGVSRGCEGGGGWKRGNRARRARESDRFDTASDGRCPHRAKIYGGGCVTRSTQPPRKPSSGKLVTRASPQPSPRFSTRPSPADPPSSKKAPSRSERGEAENPLGAKPASHPLRPPAFGAASQRARTSAAIRRRPPKTARSNACTAQRGSAQTADHAQDGPHSSATCR